MTSLDNKLHVLPQVKIRMIKEGRPLLSDRPFNQPDAAAEVVSKALESIDREVLICVCLDNLLRPVNYSIISIGTLSYCMISIPNIFKTAILSNVETILLAHNHPSGKLWPTRVDIESTKNIVEAGRIIGIRILDHIICAGDHFLSMKELSAEGDLPDIFY